MQISTSKNQFTKTESRMETKLSVLNFPDTRCNIAQINSTLETQQRPSVETLK